MLWILLLIRRPRISKVSLVYGPWAMGPIMCDQMTKGVVVQTRIWPPWIQDSVKILRYHKFFQLTCHESPLCITTFHDFPVVSATFHISIIWLPAGKRLHTTSELEHHHLLQINQNQSFRCPTFNGYVNIYQRVSIWYWMGVINQMRTLLT